MLLARVRDMVVGSEETREVDSSINRLFFPFLILVASIALLMRIDDLGYVADSLWAEDGSIYINQAHELGWRSLWVPYAGYQFLYPRIVALLASPLPLAVIPYVFFFAWWIAFILIADVLKDRAKEAGLNEPLILFLICAIALQPNHGESFFNLTNTHTILGIALAFYVCIPTPKPASVRTILFLILASLSGPFSAFLIPILAMQLILLRDFSARKATYIVVPLCGLIQAIFILGSERMDGAQTDTDLTHWNKAISTFLYFGGSNTLGYRAAVIFWVIAAVFLCKWLAEKWRSPDRILWLTPFFATATAFFLFFLGALASVPELVRLSPLDICSRYFLIPYSLLFFTALVCTKDHRAAQVTTIALISAICGAGYLNVDRSGRGSSLGVIPYENMQWTAFAKFGHIKADLVIPINPQLPIYPLAWTVDLKKGAAESSAIQIPKPILLTPQSGQIHRKVDPSDGASFRETQADRALYFDIKNDCAMNKYLALEVDIWRARMGWARLHWGKPGTFDSERSLTRFYPGGSVVMQFAFRRDTSEHLLKLDPVEGVTDLAFARFSQRVSRGVPPPAGVTVAEPTQPGGEMRISEVRLFCLQ
jgi:hypothetical protein